MLMSGSLLMLQHCASAVKWMSSRVTMDSVFLYAGSVIQRQIVMMHPMSSPNYAVCALLHAPYLAKLLEYIEGACPV